MEKGLLTVIGIAGLVAWLCRDTKKANSMSGIRKRRARRLFFMYDGKTIPREQVENAKRLAKAGYGTLYATWAYSADEARGMIKQGKAESVKGLKNNLGTFPLANPLSEKFFKDEYKYTFDEFAKKAFYTQTHQRTDDTFGDFKKDKVLRDYYYREIEKALYQNKHIPQKVLDNVGKMQWIKDFEPWGKDPKVKMIPESRGQMTLFGGSNIKTVDITTYAPSVQKAILKALNRNDKFVNIYKNYDGSLKVTKEDISAQVLADKELITVYPKKNEIFHVKYNRDTRKTEFTPISYTRKPKTIPEQTSFTEPSQMTLFGGLGYKGWDEEGAINATIKAIDKFQGKPAYVYATYTGVKSTHVKPPLGQPYYRVNADTSVDFVRYSKGETTEKRVINAKYKPIEPKKKEQMTLFGRLGAVFTGNEPYMKASPISPELQRRFDNTTFTTYDLNKEFDESVNAKETETFTRLNAYGIKDIPEDIKTALAYYRKAMYEFLVTKANQVPGPMVTGPSKYNYTKLEKSIAREDKALESVDTAKEYLRKSIDRNVKGKKTTAKQQNHDEWKAIAVSTPKKDFADKMFQSAYESANPNLRADYDAGVFVRVIKNKGKKLHEELIDEAIQEGLEIAESVKKDYPEKFGLDKQTKQKKPQVDVVKELTEQQRLSQEVANEWSRPARERIEATTKRLEERKPKTMPEQTTMFKIPSQMTLFGYKPISLHGLNLPKDADSLPPILGWVGGKTKLADKIISMMPPHKVYVEPFLGGGSVFFKKPLADVNVINDLDKDLMNFYKGVRDGSCEKIRDCKLPKNRTEFSRAVDGMKDVCSYLGVNKRSYASLGRAFSYIPEKSSHLINFNDSCERHKDKLSQAKILNKDFKDVIKEFDSKDTLAYIDPPYVDVGEALYKHGKINPEDVAKLVKSMKGKAIVSYNNHPRVRKAFAGLKFHKERTRYQLQRSTTGTHKDVSELLITNF